MEKFLDFGLELAKNSGKILKNGFMKKKKISRKKGRELVTEIDIKSEKFIIDKIKKNYPTHSILAEETIHDDISDDFCWVIDPLDGTNNYAHDFPFFCVSIALLKNKEVILGIIYEPLREELFYTKNNKSYLNGQSISVSEKTDINDTILATGFPYGLSPTSENNLDLFSQFSYNSLGIRRAGSAALDLAYVACGRMDGFWELKLKPWDMAAGSLIVKNAGGINSNFKGETWTVKADRIVAANPNIHPQMLKIITDVYSKH